MHKFFTTFIVAVWWWVYEKINFKFSTWKRKKSAKEKTLPLLLTGFISNSFSPTFNIVKRAKNQKFLIAKISVLKVYKCPQHSISWKELKVTKVSDWKNFCLKGILMSPTFNIVKRTKNDKSFWQQKLLSSRYINEDSVLEL